MTPALIATKAELIRYEPGDGIDDAQAAAAGFLARYSDRTLEASTMTCARSSSGPRSATLWSWPQPDRTWSSTGWPSNNGGWRRRRSIDV